MRIRRGTVIETNKGFGIVLGGYQNGIAVKLNSGRIAKMVRKGNVDCPQCGGSGEDTSSPYPGGGYNDCEMCGGSGIVFDSEKRLERRSLRSKRERVKGDDGSMVGEMMYCERCKTQKRCVKVIPANMQHADPTEAYTLECGHTVI